MTDELISNALLAARLLRPYYARAIGALTPIVREGLGTVAVDARWHLYYDPVWLETLPPHERGAVIAAHEVEHLLRNHHSRAKVILAEHRPWNICADCEINDDAADGELPDFCLHPKHFGWQEGLTAEDYYHLAEKQACKNGSTCGGGSGAGCPNDWEKGDGGVDPAQVEQLRDDVAADVRSFVKENGRGSVPANVAVWADARAIKVTVHWRTLLRRALNSSITHVRGRDTWSKKPARRQKDEMPISPGTARAVPTVGVVVDTSGSMGLDGPIVLGAINAIRGISNQITYVACDAAVATKGKRLPREWRGGGGTDLTHGISEVTKCDVVVVITDGETPWPETMPAQTIVLCTTSAELPAGVKEVRIVSDEK